MTLLLILSLLLYNTENLFDTTHDEGRDDYEFLPTGKRKWTQGRYYQKLNDVARVIHQAAATATPWAVPDIVGMTEVENDDVMKRLTTSTILSKTPYKYIITQADDPRGIDVALMYNPRRLKLLSSKAITTATHQTRQILHTTLLTQQRDTLHAFVVHAPSRARGRAETEPRRLKVVSTLLKAVSDVRAKSPEAAIIIMGDFNDYSYNTSIKQIVSAGFYEPKAKALNNPGIILGTYYYKRQWGSLDHIFVSKPVRVKSLHIFDAPWMLEKNADGDVIPRRTFKGEHYNGGVSDHLPLIMQFKVK